MNTKMTDAIFRGSCKTCGRDCLNRVKVEKTVLVRRVWDKRVHEAGRFCNCLFLVVGMAAFSATADGVREDELSVASDVQDAAVSQAADLRNRWPVASLGEIGLPYSAVGWDFTEKAAGATVRLNLLEGAFVGGSFSPGTDSRDLATGLTGKGTYTWLPSGVEKKVYRILHETTRGGTVEDDETFCAYFDFADCEMVTESEFRGAVLGVSQPVTPVDDVHHPWSRIGGDGEGLRNDADGATLSFTFTGTGTFAAELLFTAGSVLVTLDGETVAEVPANAAWTEYAWSVTDYDAHTLTLTYGGEAGVRVRGCAFAGDEAVALGDRTSSGTLDARTVFPVASLEDEALDGLMYSAIGWERDAAADATRTVTITAQSGTLADGVFTSDGTAAITVLAATTGRGTFDWTVTDISKKPYRLTHTVSKSGSVDTTAYLYGYLDFTDCNIWASQADVEAAVLGEITHAITVTQDDFWPWQPLDVAVERSGIVTDDALEEDEETATTFAFKGHGILHYDYDLTGGTLAVTADGETVSTFTDPTVGWTSCTVAFTGYGAHTVVFGYTADGLGGTAALRNVRWEETDIDRSDQVAERRVDLRPSPRQILKREWVLPFQYSATNWTGLATAAADPKSAVSIVRLRGSDSDPLTSWTEEPKTRRVLLRPTPGEGETRWTPHRGVWKATHIIVDGDKTNCCESAILDLRDVVALGTCISIR